MAFVNFDSFDTTVHPMIPRVDRTGQNDQNPYPNPGALSKIDTFWLKKPLKITVLMFWQSVQNPYLIPEAFDKINISDISDISVILGKCGILAANHSFWKKPGEPNEPVGRVEGHGCTSGVTGGSENDTFLTYLWHFLTKIPIQSQRLSNFRQKQWFLLKTVDFRQKQWFWPKPYPNPEAFRKFSKIDTTGHQLTPR